MNKNKVVLAMYLFFTIALIIIGIIDLLNYKYVNAIFPLVMSLIFIYWTYTYQKKK